MNDKIEVESKKSIYSLKTIEKNEYYSYVSMIFLEKIINSCF